MNSIDSALTLLSNELSNRESDFSHCPHYLKTRFLYVFFPFILQSLHFSILIKVHFPAIFFCQIFSICIFSVTLVNR